jgi:hypothetical protein
MGKLTKQKSVEMLNNETGDVIKQFAIKGKYRLIGSNSLRANQYGSDYDVSTDLKGTSTEKIAKLMQNAYKAAEKNPDLWITDFKCGWDDRLAYHGDFSKKSLDEYLLNPLIPKKRADAIRKASGEEEIDLVRDLYILRWKPADIKRGYVKLIDGKKKALKDCILDPTTMKIDLIAQVGNQFAEISENYYVKIGNKTNGKPPSEAETEADFEDEIRYYSRVNSFKALKRLYSLFGLKGNKTDKPKMERLIDFFNGQVGYLNKIRNELTILEELLKQDFRKPKWEDIYANLQYIKEQISQIYEIDLRDKVFKEIDDIRESDALKEITKLKDYFSGVINRHSKDFLKSFL